MTNKIIDTQYFMECGCVLNKKELILHATILACPKHLKCIAYINKPCTRCGAIIRSNSSWSNKVFCKDCYTEVSLARTIYSQKEFDRIFIDPILWHKTVFETLDDISFNVCEQSKKNQIQIDIPRDAQHELSIVVIDIKEKLENLQSYLQEHSQEPLCENSQVSN